MYTINNTRGTILTTINDGVVDTTTTMKLIGRQYQNYGEPINENMIKLLENSANPNAPGNPLEGELWYDTTNGYLKINRGGDSSLSWLPIATTENGESNITIVGDDSTGTAINLGEDFQIAGISLGESALNLVSENTIITSPQYTYKDDEFYSADIMKKFGKYDAIQLHLKKGDKKYIIYGVSGGILFGEAGKYYPKSEKACKNMHLRLHFGGSQACGFQLWLASRLGTASVLGLGG